MPTELLPEFASFGVAGLLFVMWWVERHERTRGAADLKDAVSFAAQLTDTNRRLMDVLTRNTEALTALRDELRAYREAEGAFLARLAERIEELG